MRYLLMILVVGLCGCGSNAVNVQTTSDDDDIFRAPEAFDDEKEAARTAEDGTLRRRAPFITLGDYRWDYDAFLADLKHSIAGLELPRSAETRVRLVFRADAIGPAVELECGSTPVECADLGHRLDNWPGWPQLPSTCPHEELEVILSNLP